MIDSAIYYLNLHIFLSAMQILLPISIFEFEVPNECIGSSNSIDR